MSGWMDESEGGSDELREGAETRMTTLHARKRVGYWYHLDGGERMRDMAIVGGVDELVGVEVPGNGDFVFGTEEVAHRVEGGGSERVDVEVAVVVPKGVCSRARATVSRRHM